MLDEYLSTVAIKGKAAFFAVCRGKLAEGIDFTDDAARAVIMAGIPYPQVFDPKVLIKKDFLDREAKVYHRVYGEVEQAVSTFAKSNRIAVVLRFDGEAVDPKEADRGKIMAHLSRPIVYHDGLVDITLDVLRMLNGPVAAQPQRQPLR